ncbi:hypothetical protein FKP32DRAFT_462358 [Trametes sanguinea]|nr:hypothetical protein FKP32DRAFT_462358 [Trametes sanguinea]
MLVSMCDLPKNSLHRNCQCSRPRQLVSQRSPVSWRVSLAKFPPAPEYSRQSAFCSWIVAATHGRGSRLMTVWVCRKTQCSLSMQPGNLQAAAQGLGSRTATTESCSCRDYRASTRLSAPPPSFHLPGHPIVCTRAQDRATHIVTVDASAHIAVSLRHRGQTTRHSGNQWAAHVFAHNNSSSSHDAVHGVLEDAGARWSRITMSCMTSTRGYHGPDFVFVRPRKKGLERELLWKKSSSLRDRLRGPSSLLFLRNEESGGHWEAAANRQQ